MPHLWIQIAVLLYGVALVFTLSTLAAGRERMAKAGTWCAAIGSLFHLVAFVELNSGADVATRGSWHQALSLLALLIMAAFLVVLARYKNASTGTFVIPAVFLMTLTASLGQHPAQFSSPLLQRTSVTAHVALILLGYATLLFSMGASLLYLLQERRLKTKQRAGLTSRTPSLAVIDEIGYRCLLVGFPAMTLGLIFGIAIAQANFGPQYFRDPKVLLSFIVWAVYLLLLFTRLNAGWRGKRAAILATVAVISAAGAWAANMFSYVHRYVGP